MDAKDDDDANHARSRFIPPSRGYQIQAEMFREELAAINSRRRTYGQSQVDAGSAPSSALGLVGLAFSGGGIRSATVNIGIIQGLGGAAVIERVDYLSTVSGGGFAGGCLSTSLTTAPRETFDRVVICGLPEGAHVEHGTLMQGTWEVAAPPQQAADFTIEVRLPRISSANKCQLKAFAYHAGQPHSPGEPPTGIPVSASIEAGAEISWRKITDGEAWGIEISRAPETAVTLRLARAPFPFVFRRPPYAPESVAMQHLREFADYLKPHRAFSALRIPALFIMGFITNFFVLIPWLLIIAAVTYAAWSDDIEHALCTNSSEVTLTDDDFNDEGYATLLLDRFLVAPETCPDGDTERLWVNLVNIPTQAHLKDEQSGCWKAQGHEVDRSQTILECDNDRARRTVKIGLAAFDDPFSDHLDITVRAWRTPKPPTIFKLGKASERTDFESDPISELTDSTFNYVLGLMWLFVLMMLAYPLWKTPTQWSTRDTITRLVFGVSLVLLLGVTVVELQPLGTYYFASAVGAPESGNLLGDLGDMAVFLLISATVIGGLIARSSLAKSLGRTLLMYGVAVFGFLTLWFVAAYFTLWLLDCNHAPGLQQLEETNAAQSLEQFFSWLDDVQPVIRFTDPMECSLQQPSAELALVYFIVALLLILVTHLRFNINNTSFHHFYRDRLSRAFSFNPWNESAEHVDRIPLQDLATDRGPFQILNTTLNLPSTKIGSLKGRRCDFFVFTPTRVGGHLTGYVRTEDYAHSEPGFDLISAMAVSGAAAAPTMGVYTNRALVFLMALLNVRLDFWAHNPNLHKKPPVHPGTVGAFYLLREMFGALDEGSRFVNLSDGGHLENLGAYELLRRHCRLIICSDCQADEHMLFDGLADLIRLVRIDMGIEIDIDIADLKSVEENALQQGLSKAHFVVGRIIYGPQEEGVFVFIKASLTGDEGLYIDNYRSDHESFPNETTADQFFDEPQFEAYRSLGQHLAEKFLESPTAAAWLDNDEIDTEKILEASGVR